MPRLPFLLGLSLLLALASGCAGRATVPLSETRSVAAGAPPAAAPTVLWEAAQAVQQAGVGSDARRAATAACRQELELPIQGVPDPAGLCRFRRLASLPAGRPRNSARIWVVPTGDGVALCQRARPAAGVCLRVTADEQLVVGHSAGSLPAALAAARRGS